MSIWPYEPNDNLNEMRIIRDCRYRYVTCPDFEEAENVKEDFLSTVEAQLLLTRKGSMDLSGVKTFGIHGAYFSLCTLEESQRGDHFTV